jgi:hypothetical protein
VVRSAESRQSTTRGARELKGGVPVDAVPSYRDTGGNQEISHERREFFNKKRKEKIENRK